MMNFNRYSNPSAFRMMADGIAAMIGIPNPELGTVTKVFSMIFALVLIPVCNMVISVAPVSSVLFAVTWAMGWTNSTPFFWSVGALVFAGIVGILSLFAAARAVGGSVTWNRK